MRLGREGFGGLDEGLDPVGFVGEENFIHRRIIGGVTGFLGGGPVGAIAGVLGGGAGPRRPPSAPPGVPVLREPGIGGAIARALPGGGTGLMIPRVAGQLVPAGMTLACPSGAHPNKSTYWLNNGTRVEKGTRCVRNRRRNPMNPRALSRAISRVDAGKALQGKLAEITTRKWTSAGKRKSEH